ncbi:hypothetical protein C9374_009769 [Naegleria lovaniensis]|uniref:O-methyltransferase n=1 Tax=Naegleria lovaniensis TaxID=51637 RepID=A0AA88H5K1_NAELO|nr:uncharacterized protein C9374_009769 [Naegleria lovaniensis]KAG2393192.1 hypothetical protein C9374_009769 [Naegleria lovaniensis]
MKPSFVCDPAVLEYVRQICVRETKEQIDLREETREKMGSRYVMVSAPEQMQLLQILLKLIGAKNILEIGCFTGYGSLCFALATQDTGAKITTLDVSEEFVQIGRKYWKQAGVEDRIEVVIQPALESLEELKKEKKEFDFIYVDADKFVIDNTLRHGNVINEQDQSEDILAIRQTNNMCRDDQRWDVAMETIADGVTFLRKK